MLNQFNSLIQLFGVESKGLVKLPHLGVAVHISLDLRLMFPKDAERFTDDDYLNLFDLGGHYALSFKIHNHERSIQVVGSLNELYQVLNTAVVNDQAFTPEERDHDDEVIAALKEEADEELDSLMEVLDEESDDEYGDDSEDEAVDEENDIDLDDEEEEVITVSRPSGKATSKKFQKEVDDMVKQLGELFPSEVGDDVPEDLLHEVLVTIFEDIEAFDLSTSFTLREQLEEYVEF